ncbi:MAG TPA: DUF3857 domain-containing protein, partial [Chitinophaga sp.]
MKKCIGWMALCLAGWSAVQAQEKPLPYAVAAIPDSLKKNAHAVIREENLVFRMEDADRTREIDHYVVTVLDPQGDRYGHMVDWYQPGMREIRSIKGVLYDPAGQQIRKLKQSDIRDGSDVDESTMMTDARYKRYDFAYSSYPYTVEYEVEIKNYNSFLFPRWRPQAYDWVAVQHSAFTMQLPDNYPLRYRAEHTGKPRESAPEKGMRQYDWEVNNIAAVHHEVMAEAWSRRSPNVITGPGDFEMQQYKGNMNSWNNMGKFFYTLNAGRDVLPPSVLAKVHQLTDTLKDTNAKISALYNYLQQNTRYVSVQLGIGGWQTFDAAYVSQKGYGDCKALSNYMY